MSGKYLTGDKNLDAEIIMNLSDDELQVVCKVNKYIAAICESESFWVKRLLKRIQTSKENIRKILIAKMLVAKMFDIPINVEGLNTMKNIFGFGTMKELNDYLNLFLPNATYQIYINSKHTSKNEGSIILGSKDFFTIDKEKLPKYINYDELIYEIRRQLQINYFYPDANRMIERPDIDLEVSGFERTMHDSLKISKVWYDFLKQTDIIE